MLGHIATDLNQGALPALLPFLIKAHGMGYASAAGLIFASSLVSSVVQPLFGHLGDKFEHPKLMCLGVILASAGIGLMGFFDDYAVMFVLAMITGIGVALFHPEASKHAVYVSGENKGESMGTFAVGGNIGFTVGPIACSVLLLTFGLKGTLGFIVIGIAMTAILLFQIPHIQAAGEGNRIRRSSPEFYQKDDWPSFVKVTLAMFCRAIVGTCMSTFVTLFFIDVLMQSVAVGNTMLSVFAVAGAIATYFGGKLSDVVGFKRMVMICSVAVVPFLFLIVFTTNPVVAAIVGVMICLTLNGCHTTLIVMGQSFLPHRLGLASGVMYGLTVSVGGMAAPLIGLVADDRGIPAGMFIIACVSVVALVFALIIPDIRGIPREGEPRINDGPS
ncbi:MAG: MFS transporter [Clostridiales Family XIII bacterium]|nr:MFS transporter [Clostridiales Family XIII bacterium]